MLRTRVLIGLSLIAVLLGILLGDRAVGYPVVGAVLLVAFALQAERELLGMSGARAFLPAVMLLTLGMIAVKAWGEDQGREMVAAVGPFAVFTGGVLVLAAQATFRLQLREEVPVQDHARGLAAAVFGLAYVGLPMLVLWHLMLSRSGGDGSLLAVTLVLVSKCGDIGGYLVGAFFGKHRVMPRVSPKKSWEGGLAGLALTVAAAVGFAALAPGILGISVGAAGALGLVMNVATQMGDFSESMIKRSCAVKDSASILPTFGGALDIIDSLVFAVPAAWTFLWLAG